MVERIVVVEDHAMMLDGLLAVFSDDPRIDVVGTAQTLSDFTENIADWDPTMIVADFQLPDGNATEIPVFLQSISRELPVLVMSGVATTHVLDRVMASGCAGYVSKALRSAQLTDAIVNVGRGASVFPPETLQAYRSRSPIGSDLTPRELDVLRLLAAAKSAHEITEELGVSMNTARNHIRSILSKLHARSQLEAVLIALRSGLVGLDEP